MINLFRYYEDNVRENEYYYRFYNDIVTIPHNIYQSLIDSFGVFSSEEYEDFNFYDIDEVIEKFKYLCQPDVDVTTDINKRMFYYVCYFLYKNGYTIKQFPQLLSRPPVNPFDFTYRQIRSKLVSMDKQRPNGEVPYKERRIFIEQLIFESKSTIKLEEDLDTLFIKISTRNASFEEMAIDEKLKEIANLIEFMLYDKDRKEYKTLDYNKIAFNYIDDNIVKNFRKKIQCFRHASENAIRERKDFSEEQKFFLIDYGIVVIKVIHQIIK